MSKSATNKLYLKQKFYGLKMQEGSDLMEHVNAFNQLVTDLARLDVKIEDEDKGMYNGAILGVPCRINDEVEERELIRKGLSSLI